MRKTTLLCLVALFLAVQAVPAADKELIRLQSDVLALQNQLRALEKTFAERSDNLNSLVTQLLDQVGKSNVLLNRVSTSIESQTSGDRSNNQALLQEIRSLGGKIDDAATRISALAQQVNDLKVQSKAMSTRSYQGGDGTPGSLSADTVYNEAFNDLIQGNFDLAIEGFTAFVRNFPSHERADDALYGIGESYYNSNRLPQAVSGFTRVLNDYPSGDKVPSALFKRAKAELAMQERDNAIADFKLVVQKYPATTEAGLAKSELERLGIDLSRPAKPAPAPPRKKKP